MLFTENMFSPVLTILNSLFIKSSIFSYTVINHNWSCTVL